MKINTNAGQEPTFRVRLSEVEAASRAWIYHPSTESILSGAEGLRATRTHEKLPYLYLLIPHNLIKRKSGGRFTRFEAFDDVRLAEKERYHLVQIELETGIAIKRREIFFGFLRI